MTTTATRTHVPDLPVARAASPVAPASRAARFHAVACNDPIAWDDAQRRSAQACIYLSRTWLEALNAVDAQPLALTLLESGRPAAGLIGRAVGPAGAARLERLPHTAYSGIWLAARGGALPGRREGHELERLAALAEAAERRFELAEIDLHPANGDVRAFNRAGWTTQVRYTYVTALTADFEAAVAPAVRRRARRAAAAGVTFDEAVGGAEFVSLWMATCARRRIRAALPPARLEALLNVLRNAGACTVYGARLPSGALAAAAAVLYDAYGTAYYWLATFDATEPQRGASNQLCHLHMLRRSAGRAARFDWLGANTPSIAEYKRQFGPALVPCYRVTWRRLGPCARPPRFARLRDWLFAAPPEDSTE